MSPEERSVALTNLADLRPATLRFAHYLTRSQDDSEDLVQTAFVNAIEHIGAWQGRGPLKNWLIRIVTNQNRRSSRNRQETVGDPASFEQLADEAGWTAAPDIRMERQEQIVRIQEALLMLSEEDREVLLMRDVEEIDGREVAEILGTTLPAMKSRLHRARLRLLAEVEKSPAAELRPNAALTGLTCMQVLEQLGDYADGALEAAATQAIDAHLAHCGKCRLFGRRYADLLDQLPRI